ncbi:histone deacetylase family protein [Salinicola sp. DM10]|uniref:histone deacetylase family protein n=1 Tax=Salinicola sp. DM10 TaxID=2815721 RepID=UPI001A8D2B32|nr:histone deacetylase family protein [Salinicola sp. DM10]MCE3025697.1 histone deacetylase family protein [Salinicola sp. DM10]
MITSYLTHPDFARHDMGGSHPEAPVRLEVIRKRLMLSGLLQQTMQSEAPPAKPLALARVHAPDYLETLACQRPQNGLQTLDNDTRMGPWTLEAAALAAGAAIKGVDLVCGNRADNVFCAVRPPGHHAERALAMGFCFYNNVAVAAAHARAVHGLERIAILDFDVHQGNGTLDIFHDDPSVLICSSYQEAFYPWRYLEGDWPNVVNTPLPAGTASRDFRLAIERDWLPALERHRPQLVLLSSGFDAHRDDPLGELALEHGDFYWITHLAMDIARRYAGGKLVSVLEGGYHPKALPLSVEAHLTALLGQPYPG